MSRSGRFVSFPSIVAIIPGDTNGTWDAFVHDRWTGETVRESVDSAGTEADWGGEAPTIASEGRFAVFTSFATNLVPGDDIGVRDVFVRDLFDCRAGNVNAGHCRLGNAKTLSGRSLR